MIQEYHFSSGLPKIIFGRGKLVEVRMREPSSGEGFIPSSDDLTDHKRCQGLSIRKAKDHIREQADGDYQEFCHRPKKSDARD